MGNKSTKQIILDEALSLFAINGYEGVTVADGSVEEVQEQGNRYAVVLTERYDESSNSR